MPPGPGFPSLARVLAEQLRSLTNDPAQAAVFCDIDGTLAPIVERPDEARVPEAVSRLLGTLSVATPAWPAFPAGRRWRRGGWSGSDGIAYAGLHGAELLSPGQERPRLIAPFQSWQAAVRGFTAVHANVLQALGIRIEDKGPIAAFHWRGVPDEEAALAQLERVADAAKEAGLSARWGRKVLEVWPPVRHRQGPGGVRADRSEQGAGGTVRRRRRHRP